MLLTRWAFDELGALRAYLYINVENVPSLRVAQRAGYVREGVLRSLHLKQRPARRCRAVVAATGRPGAVGR